MTAEVIPHDHSERLTLPRILLEADYHLVVDGVAPAIAVGAQSTSVASLGTGIKDMAGMIRATSIGSANAAGAIVTVTFAVPFDVAPRAVLLSARSLTAVGIGLYVSALSTTAMTISASAAPAASTVYDFSYLVLG